MADITANVLKYLKVKETTLVNGFFKLFSVGSVAICILGSLLCAATQVPLSLSVSLSFSDVMLIARML